MCGTFVLAMDRISRGCPSCSGADDHSVVQVASVLWQIFGVLACSAGMLVGGLVVFPRLHIGKTHIPLEYFPPHSLYVKNANR